MNYDEATGWFEQIYGRAPEVVACAPGRVNLIGEHTDTSEGFVFPAAIERRLWFMAARSSASTSRVVSRELGEAEPFDFMTADPRSVAGWAGLVAGMARAIGIETGYAPPAFDAAVASFIPIGAGLASSAALCVGAGLALARLAGTELEPMRLALSAQRVENEFLGVACGVMDPISCALSREGSAMFLDTRSLEIRYAAIPDSLTIAICDTGVPRSLAKSAYNQRRAECERAAAVLGVPTLRDARPEDVDRSSARLGSVLTGRARHVTTENDRCRAFLNALEHCDLGSLGALMRASHESLRDAYEVSCPELDAMAEAARAAPGCEGARMTGAGFGGACVALVDQSRFASFEAAALEGYSRATGREGTIFESRPSDGTNLLIH